MSENPRRWRPGSLVMVRAPALPIEMFVSLSTEHNPDRFDADTDPLARLLRDPEVELALRIASPSIGLALDTGPAALKQRKLRRALLAYLTRMATRSTPFGLFAGVATATWAERTQLVLSHTPRVRRVRPDMGWLSALVRRLERDPDVRSQLEFRTHPAVVQRGARLFIATQSADHGGIVAAQPEVSVRATPAVLAVLAMCRAGLSYAATIEALVPGDRDRTKARMAVDTLVEHGFLVSSLRPPLTGDPIGHVCDTLRRAVPESCAAPLPALREFMSALSSWQQMTGSAAIEGWRGLVGSASALEPHDPPLQVDAAFDGPALTLPRAVAREAARAAELLFRFSGWIQHASPLHDWRTRFETRWGSWQAVPVLEAFDEDLGLGLPLRQRPVVPESRDYLLLQLAGDALRTGARSIDLDERTIADIERASGAPPSAPHSIDLFCALAAENPRAIEEGRFLLVVANNGAVCPGGRAFGRFAHLLGENAAGVAADTNDAQDGTIDAELLFEPTRPRSANVMIRPLTRRYAVLVSGAIPCPAPVVIPLDELVVVLRHGRLHLHWTRRDVDVCASALHMLNPRLAPPLARALHAVSLDASTAAIGEFSWGAAERLPFRPRLQAGRVVLRTAEWSVDRRFFSAYAADRAAALDAWSMPRYLSVGLSEERLLIDASTAAGAELLLDVGRRLAGRETVVVREALPSPEHACAQGVDGRRLVEFVASFTRAADPGGAAARAPRVAVQPHERLKMPGSEWLYVKLYLARRVADDFIAGPLREQAEALEAEGLISSWFFIRYIDPTFHVRLRVTGDPTALVRQVLPHLSSWARGLQSRGTLDSVAFDSYAREIERYGGPAAMPIAERVFAADSRSAAHLLAAGRRLEATTDADDRACVSLDDFVATLGLDRPARVSFYRQATDGRVHATAFRERRTRLRTLLGSPGPPDPMPAILARRRYEMAGCGAALAELQSRGALTTPLTDVVRSLVHMHCNRLCGLGATAESRAIAFAGMATASLEAWPETARI